MSIQTLISEWGKMSPAEWAQNSYGWILEDGSPITLADWQRAILAEYWARRDDVSTLFVSTVKKAGKTTFNALLTCYRWLTLPGIHFGLGNDWEQGAMLQGAMIADMVKRHSVLRRYVKINKNELIFEPTGSKLITLAADYAGSAGHNFLTVSFTEVWAFTYESHTRLYEELTPPPLSGALRIVDSYAGFEGESALLKKIWERGEAGAVINQDWPITLTGQQLSYIHTGEDAQKRCWRGTEAQRVSYYQEQAETLRPGTYSRLHLNQWATNEDAFITADHWRSLVDPNHEPLPPGSKTPVFVGLDLATAAGGDNAALVGVYPDNGKVKIAFHKIWWGRDRQERLKLTETVKPYLLRVNEVYNLQGVWFDPFQALALAEELREAGIPCIEVPQTHGSRGVKDTALLDMVNNRQLVLYDDDELKDAAIGAAARELPSGLIFLKKATGRSKIDLLIALSNVANEALSGGSGEIQVLPLFFGGDLNFEIMPTWV